MVSQLERGLAGARRARVLLPPPSAHVLDHGFPCRARPAALLLAAPDAAARHSRICFPHRQFVTKPSSLIEGFECPFPESPI